MIVRMCAVALLLSGCSTLPDGSRWGENARFRVGWDRVGYAALEAAKSPWVWAPLAGAAYVASVFATPGSAAGPEWWDAKLSGGLVGLGAIAAEPVVTEGLKVTVTRTRPDGGSHSFPSGHTSFAAVSDTLAADNLEVTPMNDSMRTALVIGTDALTIATGWARVEAGAHYPSDVLVGMSIGNFFGRMFDDAFLGDGLSQRLSVTFDPARGGGELVWNLRF